MTTTRRSPQRIAAAATLNGAAHAAANGGTPVERRLAPADPFGGFFHPGWSWQPEPGGLLDIPNARRWFEVVSWGMETTLYTYQQPIRRRRGAHVEVNGRWMLQMSSYDYLGLVGHPGIERAALRAVERHGTGTGGVRLLAGTVELHRRMEQELAAFKGAEAALTFSSGYTACLAAITALFGPDDLVLADAYAHRSLRDACRLAGVTLRLHRHGDLEDLSRLLRLRRPGQRTLIVAEGVYSMDGDLCRLPELVALKREHGAFLLVDEAHGLGVLGETGRGVDEHFGVPSEAVDLWVGSLSKAVPSNGGFVCGSRELIIYLQHGAAPFMFSAAVNPPAVGATLAALRVIRNARERRARMRRNAERLRLGLRELGWDTRASETPIVPVIAGSDESAYRLARALHERGILASAVIHPAVPRGSARLRLCATASHRDSDIERVLGAFRSLRGASA